MTRKPIGRKRLPDKERRIQAGRISQKSAAYLRAMGQMNLGRAIDILIDRALGDSQAKVSR